MKELENQWKLLRVLDRKDKHGHFYGLYECSCGTIKEVNMDSVKRGLSKSCGCNRRKTGNPNFQHGLSHHPLMGVWNGIIQRCTNPNNNRYNRYGGRGIKLCKRWQSFINFYTDVIADYKPGLQIDRIDNDGDYEPGNTRWVSQTINIRNSYCTPLSDAKVNFIRRSDLSNEELAAMFHVTTVTIMNVKKQKTWANIV
jgi:hypothetical protein